MARVAIIGIAEPTTEYARTVDYSEINASYEKTNINVTDLSSSIRSVTDKDYSILKPISESRKVLARDVLPFRVMFTSVDIPGYGRENPPPIGIAVIGTNNYIL